MAQLYVLPTRVGQDTSGREPEFRPFSRLADLPPEPEWLWRGYLAPGSMTMLAGHPFAGKSFLVGALLKALEEGNPFLGQATRPATAVLVSEEDESALRSRAGLLRLLELDSEYIGRNSGALQLPWPSLIERATERALARGHRLLVVDTFPGLAGLQGEEENDAGAITQRLRPLQVAAGHGLAVLFLHHMNGQGQPRGSKALKGIVDTAIRFYRQGTSGGVALHTDSRYPAAAPATLKAKLIKAPEGWYYVGAERPEAKAETPREEESTEARLLKTLARAGSQGLTYAQIERIPGLSQHRAKKRFPTWHSDGKIGRHGTGTKTDPYRWHSLPR